MRRRTLTMAGRVGTLHRHELRLLLRIAAIVLALPLLQRLLTLPALLRLLDARVVSPPRMPLHRLLALIRGVLHQHIGVFRPNCVKQSLVLFHVLRRWGYPVRVHFGIVKRGGTLAGHCWLELDGHPLAEPADPHRVFTVVYSYPERSLTRREPDEP